MPKLVLHHVGHGREPSAEWPVSTRISQAQHSKRMNFLKTVMSTVIFLRTLFSAAGQISTNEPIQLKFGTPLEEDFYSSDTKYLSNRKLTG